jgi:hypothetical protein
MNKLYTAALGTALLLLAGPSQAAPMFATSFDANTAMSGLPLQTASIGTVGADGLRADTGSKRTVMTGPFTVGSNPVHAADDVELVRAEAPRAAGELDVPGLLVAGAILIFARIRAGKRASQLGQE